MVLREGAAARRRDPRPDVVEDGPDGAFAGAPLSLAPLPRLAASERAEAAAGSGGGAAGFVLVSAFAGAAGFDATGSGFGAAGIGFVSAAGFGAGSGDFGSGFGSSATAVAVVVTGAVTAAGGPDIVGPAFGPLEESGTTAGGAPKDTSGGGDGFFTTVSDEGAIGSGLERGATLLADEVDAAGAGALGRGGGAGRAPNPAVGPTGARGAASSARSGGGDGA